MTLQREVEGNYRTLECGCKLVRTGVGWVYTDRCDEHPKEAS